MARSNEVFIATDTFECELDGARVLVTEGERVRFGHSLLTDHPEHFKPLSDGPVKYDVEDASATPGEKRSR